MALKLIEITLLETNLEIDDVMIRSTSDVLPLPGEVVCLLHSIGSSRSHWRGEGKRSREGSTEQRQKAEHDDDDGRTRLQATTSVERTTKRSALAWRDGDSSSGGIYCGPQLFGGWIVLCARGSFPGTRVGASDDFLVASPNRAS